MLVSEGTEVGYGVEGITDAPVAEHLVRYLGCEPRPLSTSGGSSNLDRRIRKWNTPNLRLPILVLRDWDAKDQVACPLDLLSKIVGGEMQSPFLIVRIAVRSVESWLMADAAAFNSFFATSGLPQNPDDEANPKLSLVAACSKSTKPSIRDAMVPKPTSGRQVGKLYESTIVEFATFHWDPTRAAQRSPSLRRTLSRLDHYRVEV